MQKQIILLLSLVLWLLYGCSEGGSVGSGIDDGQQKDWQQRNLPINAQNTPTLINALGEPSLPARLAPDFASNAVLLKALTRESSACAVAGEKVISTDTDVVTYEFKQCQDDSLSGDGETIEENGIIVFTSLDNRADYQRDRIDYRDYEYRDLSVSQSARYNGSIEQENQQLQTQSDEIVIYQGRNYIDQLEIQQNQSKAYLWQNMEYTFTPFLHAGYPVDSPCYDPNSAVETAQGTQYWGYSAQAEGDYYSQALGGGYHIQVLEPVEYCLELTFTANGFAFEMHMLKGKIQLTGEANSRVVISVQGADDLRAQGDSDGDGIVDFESIPDRQALGRFFIGFSDSLMF